MKRSLTILALLMLQMASASAETSAAKPASGMPDIVVMVGDDVGYNDRGCYGATLIKTPRLDALAKQGVRFTDAHSTCATCQPSRFPSSAAFIL